MALHSVSTAISYVSFVHLWLDSIDAGPHPMDPNRAGSGVRQVLISGAIAELAKVSSDPGAKRRLGSLARQIGREGIAGMQAAMSDDDDETDWHPPIPKWGGGPDFEQALKWLDHLPTDALAGLVDAAAVALRSRVRHFGREPQEF